MMSHDDVTIRLVRAEWRYDPGQSLGRPGGFGQVFAGSGPSGPVAVKKLHVTAGAAAHRELKLADHLSARELKHVMPVLDAGQDSESEGYFIVMPRASGSLEDEIGRRGALGEAEALALLMEITLGLTEVKEIVHRDLKPGNVLRFDDRWVVADFGIAKFVEDATSANTLRDCLTPHYAAPEQWKGEATTNGTDLYALGCVAYELLNGKPPFDGATNAEIMAKHLTADPPASNGSPQVQQLVSMLLRKEPSARPSQARVLDLIRRYVDLARAVPATLPRVGIAALAQAGADDARRRAAAEAAAAREAARREARIALFEGGRKVLVQTVEQLFEEIKSAVPEARLKKAHQGIEIYAAGAKLEVDTTQVRFFDQGEFPRTMWDVAAGAVIGVLQSEPKYIWTASLWYTNRKGGDYRWYEVGYIPNPLTGRRGEFEPFALKAEDADAAHSPAMGVWQVSYGPLPIDDEDIGSFCDRWCRILAAAAQGKLRYPGDMSLVNK